MGLLRDLRSSGITAADIIAAVKANRDPTQEAILRIGPEESPFQMGFIATWVKIDGDATGGGVYTGRYLIQGPQTKNLDKTANITSAVVGQFGSDANTGNTGACYVFNEAEENQSTHRITAGTQNRNIFIALYIGREKSDGKPCFGISDLDFASCS